MKKIGLAGCGYMGGMHAACYEALSTLGNVTAVADILPERAQNFAKKFGAKAYKSAEEMIQNADVDVIDICLPTYLHTVHAVKAMEKFGAVFIEKPVCLKPEECKVLLDAQKKTGAKVSVGQVIRFWDEYVYLRQVIEDNRYGKFLSGSFKRHSPLPDWSWDNWINDDTRSGGMALDLHIHDVDYINYLFGEPKKVNSLAQKNSNGVIKHIFTQYEYSDKAVTAEGCWDLPSSLPFEMAYFTRFEKAAIEFSSCNTPAVKVYLNDGTSVVPEIKPQFTGSAGGGNVSSLGGYYNELKYWLECLNTGKEPVIAPLIDAVSSYKLVMKEKALV